MVMSSGKILLYLFLALVVLAPLPLGGNNPTAWTIDAFCIGVLAILLSLQNLLQKENPPVPIRMIAVPATLFIAVCFWAFIQSLSITPAFLHHPLWLAASDALARPLNSAISVNPYETRTALMRLITYGVVFWLALQFGRDKARAAIILNCLVFAIAAYALYGLVLWSIGSQTILWYDKHGWTSATRLSSTFINSNNFATFTGVGAITFAGLLMRSMRSALHSHEDEPFNYRLERVLNSFAGLTNVYLLGLLLTVAALFLTNSRAGFIFTLVGIGVLLLLNWLRSRRRRKKSGRGASKGLGLVGSLLVVAISIAGFVFLFETGGEGLSQRFASGELSSEGRKAVYPRLVEVITDFPIIGTGYGTFTDIFPMYRDESISAWGRWNKAHSTYLENMMELGLPAALALFLAIGWCIARCFIGAFNRRRDSHFAIIGFSASVLVALHSFVDFSLQIPGMAIYYAALLGLCCAQSWSSRA